LKKKLRMPTLKIDNREIEVPAGTKVIEAAEQLGIVIPRFCFHPALGAVGACRVCAVAFLEGPIKGIQMSCMISAMDGMVVSTTDPEAVDFRRHVIEWLMLNHPHDCPVCDEGGHCLLQDQTVAGGHGMRRYLGAKRTHRDQYLGPLVQHEMNRCIQCYRCSRYYQKFTGYRDLGVMGIGSRVYFGRFAPGKLESPFAGNLIDLCPTGVYTDKPSRFFGRRWDFQRSPSVCLHCSLGCSLTALARYRQVVRHEARPNPDVNGYFICDRGRYGYAYANAPDRPRQALVDGQVESVDAALAAAGERLQAVVARAGAAGVAVVGSTRSSLETMAALESLCRERSYTGPVYQLERRKAVALKTAVEHVSEDLAVSLGAISVAHAVVVIGGDPLSEAPMLTLSLRQAQQAGGHVTVIDPRPVEMPLAFDHWPLHGASVAETLRSLTRSVEADRSAPTEASKSMEHSIGRLAHTLIQSRRVVIVCGTDITTRQELDLAAGLVQALRRADTETKLFFLLDGPNAFTAGLLMKTPESLEDILDGIEAERIKALVVVENDLWDACCHRRRLMRALDRLELLVVMDHLESPLARQAHILLPTQTIYEAGGRWINQEGRIQTAHPVLAGGEPIALTGNLGHPPRVFENEIPGGATGPAWRWAAGLLGRDTHAEAFLQDALDMLEAVLGDLDPGRVILPATDPGASIPEATDEIPATPRGAVTLLLVDGTFGTESLSAGSPALVEVTPPAAAAMHSRTAGELGLGDGGEIVIATEEGQIGLPLRIDDRTAPGAIVVPRHHLIEWQALGGTRIVLQPGQIKKNSD
jgi:NADH-quinone oxidoreductase subunit G